MDTEQLKSDHDNVITIIEQIKNLTKSQFEFHQEMRNSFEDLKNNYSGRLNACEERLNKIEITLSSLVNQKLGERVLKLEKSRIYQNTMIWVGIGILSFLSALIVYHVLGTPKI